MVIETVFLFDECDQRRATSWLFAYYNWAFAVVFAIQIAILVTDHVIPQPEVRGLVILPTPLSLTIW